MTRESTRRAADGSHGESQFELDVIEALWEQITFPRLPRDAPDELRGLVINIENPKRVYTIHRAIRRHNLQLLVEKFVVQLRYGCGSHECTTYSCFSCRRRLAQKAPIRRYSPASARTLAIYFVGLDNPESRLCPRLRVTQGSSDAIKPLVLSKSSTSDQKSEDERKFKRAMLSAGPPGSVKGLSTRMHKVSVSEETPVSSMRASPKPGGPEDETAARTLPGTKSSHVGISERHVRKDYRSFAANMFGTAAFKMLEWLTPTNVAAMSHKLEDALTGDNAAELQAVRPAANDLEDGVASTPETSSVDLEHHSRNPGTPGAPEVRTRGSNQGAADGIPLRDGNIESQNTHTSTNASAPARPDATRRGSNAHGRTASIQRPQPRVSTDEYTSYQLDEQPLGLASPRSVLSQPDLVSKQLVRTASKVACQPSLDDHLEADDDDETADETTRKSVPGVEYEERHASSYHDKELTNTDESSSPISRESGDGIPHTAHSPNEPELDEFLPQSVARLDRAAIDLFCDVLQADGTVERHMLVPETVKRFSRQPTNDSKHWKRVRRAAHFYPFNLRLEWRLFIEQSVFNVLSDPQAILSSFTTSGMLMDSQTLWYCMLRLTRVAPRLVFDSLWNASGSLFEAPKGLQSPRSPSGKFLVLSDHSLTNKEAGQVLSVCFHALVAAAPLVTDSRQLVDMSRIRAHGLVLAESGTIAHQPSALCLQYEDAFADGMALRLARRLFAAISTRGYFDDLAEYGLESETATSEENTLEVLLSHLEWSSGAQPVLEFSFDERQIHEKRVPLLLLDWARTVMLKEWEGTPDVPGDGPFGGSLALIAAMHAKRNSLLLSDAAFRIEYIGDRLDAIQMPVTWLNFKTSKRRAHLLDHPHIFTSSSLVSYFRAINFSRMSRAFEESCSLLSRISAIIATDSLSTLR